MARNKSALNLVRGFLYDLARLLGDIQAASRGPEAMAKRAARKAVGKAMGRALGKLFK